MREPQQRIILRAVGDSLGEAVFLQQAHQDLLELGLEAFGSLWQYGLALVVLSQVGTGTSDACVGWECTLELIHRFFQVALLFRAAERVRCDSSSATALEERALWYAAFRVTTGQANLDSQPAAGGSGTGDPL